MKKTLILTILLSCVVAFSGDNPIVSLFADRVSKTESSQKNFPKVGDGYLIFDGESNYVQFPARKQAASFTYLTWCAPDVQAASAGALICKPGWHTLLQIGNDNLIYFKTVSQDKKFLTVIPRRKMTPQKWILVAGVYNGSSLSVFIDGTLAASLETDAKLLQTNSRYYVGCANPGSKMPLFYKGLLNGARVWERALSADDIRAIYDGEKAEYEKLK